MFHPIWECRIRQPVKLAGWIATMQTPLKLAHLENSPWVSVNYWSAEQDTCTAECLATGTRTAQTRERVWDLFANGPEPVGYNPAIIPGWESPASPGFSVMRLDPGDLGVFPGGPAQRRRATSSLGRGAAANSRDPLQYGAGRRQ